jgi:hypothetical protein
MRHLAQIAGILDWLHSGATPSRRPIVHGDISPANVIIDRNGQAVLVDFGLVRVARHVTTVAAGTRGYTAPEILSGGEYSPASDRYAFGGLAFYVLTGTHPPEDPHQLPAGLATIAGFGDQPTNVAQLATIFSTDPAARPSCTDWLRNLRLHSSTAPVRSTPLPPLAPGAPSPVPAGTAPKPTGKSQTKRAAAIIGAIFAALISITLAAVTINALATNEANPADADASTNPPNDQNTTPGEPAGQPSSNAATRPAVKTVYLANLDPVYGEWTTGPVTLDGREYTNGMRTEAQNCIEEDWIEYALSGDYVRFRGIAGFADATPYTAPVPFKVLLNDKPALTGSIQLGKPIKIDLDVRGKVRLGIVVGSDASCLDLSEALVALGDPVLEQQP